MFTPHKPLHCAGIVVTDQHIATHKDQRLIARAPIEHITHLTFAHGFLSKHFFAQVICASLLLGFAAVYWRVQARWYLEEQAIVSCILLMTGFTTLLGAWLAYDAFQRGPYLRIKGKKRSWKFALDAPVNHDELDSFIEQLSQQRHWTIENRL